MTADMRRRERAQHRQRKAYESQLKVEAKRQSLASAQAEAGEYEARVECLRSMHQEVGPKWDWHAIAERPAPLEPERKNTNYVAARDALTSYSPGWLDRLRGRAALRKTTLENAIPDAVAQDDADHSGALERYSAALVDWENARTLASDVLRLDPAAMTSAIDEIQPLSELAEMGASFSFVVHPEGIVEVEFSAFDSAVVPSEITTVLKSGKLSTKKMPVSQLQALYQDFVCGTALRIGREFFAALPVYTVVATAVGRILDTRTGHLADAPVLSVRLERDTFDQMNFEGLDASDAMTLFVHNMDFLKTKGLRAVARLAIPRNPAT